MLPLLLAQTAASDDLVPMFKALLNGVETGNWWLAAGPLLTLAVMALRKFDQNIPKVGPAISAFMDQPIVSFLLPIVLSAITGLLSALGTGMPIGPALVTAIKVAGVSIMTFVGGKKFIEQVNGAGDKAAAAVTSGPAAVDVINKAP